MRLKQFTVEIVDKNQGTPTDTDLPNWDLPDLETSDPSAVSPVFDLDLDLDQNETEDQPITEMEDQQEKQQLIEIIMTILPDLERNYLELATLDELKQIIELAKPRLDENLKQWFKEKWVRFGPDGRIRGDCARGDDSEGKPKCLPRSKAYALGKKGRASAAARKRRKDPNPERRGPAINVATKKTTKEAKLTGPYRSRRTPREKFKASLRARGFDPDQAAKKLRELLARQAKERAELDRRYAQLDGFNHSDTIDGTVTVKENLKNSLLQGVAEGSEMIWIVYRQETRLYPDGERDHKTEIVETFTNDKEAEAYANNLNSTNRNEDVYYFVRGKKQGVAEGQITEASEDFDERRYAAKEIGNLLMSNRLIDLDREESPNVTPEIIKKMKKLVAITGRGQFVPGFGSAGPILEKLIDMYRQSQIRSGQMPEFTGRATTARDMASQIANQTRGTYRYFEPQSWTTRSGQRYRDPADYVVYPDKESYDDALEWIKNKGKEVHYRDHFGDLNTATQIDRYIVEPSTFTQGAFSDDPQTTHRISVRLAKTINQGGRQQVDITDQQAAALHDIAATRSASAMSTVQSIMAVLKGMKDVQRVIANSKKIDPRDKAKLDAIISAAGNQGVAEGYNLDSHIKQTRDRILKYKDWNTTGSHDKKIKELQDKLKELLAQKKQGVAESKQKCPECGGALVEFSQLNEKKDACYYKVKATAKVWPSAYASGRLVQCRKKGAKNWGNKS